MKPDISLALFVVVALVTTIVFNRAKNRFRVPKLIISTFNHYLAPAYLLSVTYPWMHPLVVLSLVFVTGLIVTMAIGTMFPVNKDWLKLLEKRGLLRYDWMRTMMQLFPTVSNIAAITLFFGWTLTEGMQGALFVLYFALLYIAHRLSMRRMSKSELSERLDNIPL